MFLQFQTEYEKVIPVSDLNREEALVLTIDTMKYLEWSIRAIDDFTVLAFTKISWFSVSEAIHIEVGQDFINILSRCRGFQVTDWGKNKRNVKFFEREFFDRAKQKSSDLQVRYETLTKSHWKEVLP